MIPEVIVIFLLTTAVVTSIKLHPVNQCPNDKEWFDRAHIVCNNNEYRYHCMFSVHCSLVESCIEPQLGSYRHSETEYGVYFLYLNNEIGSPEFYQITFKHPLYQHLITNSSDYWKYLYFANCKNHTKDIFVFSRTENQTKCEDCSENKMKCEDCSENKMKCEDWRRNYNKVLKVAIIGWVLAFCILVVCVIVCVLFYKSRKTSF